MKESLKKYYLMIMNNRQLVGNWAKKNMLRVAMAAMVGMGMGMSVNNVEAADAKKGDYIVVRVDDNTPLTTADGKNKQTFTDTAGKSYTYTVIDKKIGDTTYRYAVRDGWTLQSTDEKRYPNAGMSNMLTVYKDTTSATDALFSVSDTTVLGTSMNTVLNKNIITVKDNGYVGAVNTTNQGTPYSHQYIILKNGTWQNVGSGENNIKAAAYEASCDAGVWSVQINGQKTVVDSSNVYEIGGKNWVFKNDSGGVYTGSVFGYNNELLKSMTVKTGETTTAKLTVWGTDRTDADGELAQLTVGQVNKITDTFTQNDINLAKADIKQVNSENRGANDAANVVKKYTLIRNDENGTKVTGTIVDTDTITTATKSEDGKTLTISKTGAADVVFTDTDTTYTAGTNVTINGTQISAKDTVNSAVSVTGEGTKTVTITDSEGHTVTTTFTDKDTTYTAGTNVTINGTQISATDTITTATKSEDGKTLTISKTGAADVVFTDTDTTYTAGANVTINGTQISATDTITTVEKLSTPSTGAKNSWQVKVNGANSVVIDDTNTTYTHTATNGTGAQAGSLVIQADDGSNPVTFYDTNDVTNLTSVAGAVNASDSKKADITVTTTENGSQVSKTGTVDLSTLTTNQGDTNTQNIATNTQNIATNTQNIATNTQNIATNTQNIATNTQNITDITNYVHTNEEVWATDTKYSMTQKAQGTGIVLNTVDAQGKPTAQNTVDFSSTNKYLTIQNGENGIEWTVNIDDIKADVTQDTNTKYKVDAVAKGTNGATINLNKKDLADAEYTVDSSVDMTGDNNITVGVTEGVINVSLNKDITVNNISATTVNATTVNGDTVNSKTVNVTNENGDKVTINGDSISITNKEGDKVTNITNQSITSTTINGDTINGDTVNATTVNSTTVNTTNVKLGDTNITENRYLELEAEAQRHTTVSEGANVTVTPSENEDGSMDYKVALNSKIEVEQIKLGDTVIEENNITMGDTVITNESITSNTVNATTVNTETINLGDTVITENKIDMGDTVITNESVTVGDTVINGDSITTTTINGDTVNATTVNTTEIKLGDTNITENRYLELEAEAQRHTTVSEGANVTVTPSENEDGSMDYKVALNSKIEVEQIKLGDTVIEENNITMGDTVITNESVTVGDTVINGDSITTTTINGETVNATTVNTETINLGDTVITENKIDMGDTVITNESVTVGDTVINGDSITTTTVNTENIKLGDTNITENRYLELEAEAQRHTTVSEGANVTVTPSENEDGSMDYKVALNSKIEVEQIKLGDTVIEENNITMGDTHITNESVTVGDTVINGDSITTTTVNATTVEATTVNTTEIKLGDTNITENRYLELEAEAQKHTTVSEGANITVTPSENEDGSMDYKVALNSKIEVEQVKLGDTIIEENNITMGDTVITNESVTVGDTVINGDSITTTTVNGDTINGDTVNATTVNGDTVNSQVINVTNKDGDVLTKIEGDTITTTNVVLGDEITLNEENVKKVVKQVNDNTENIERIDQYIQDNEDDWAHNTKYTVEGTSGAGGTEKPGSVDLTDNDGGSQNIITAGTGLTIIEQDGKNYISLVNPYTPQSLDDDLQFTGDSGTANPSGGNVNVVGGADPEKLTDGNIGVVADGSTLTVKLSKDIDLGEEGSVTVGNTKIENNNVTVGDTTITNDTISIKDGPTINREGIKVGDTTINNGGVKTNSLTVNRVVIDESGINAGGQKITNVAAGTADTDAVNVSQLKEATGDINQSLAKVSNNVQKLGGRINKVGARAAALAALHPMDFDPDDKLTFAAGYGNYRGESAAAIGAFYRPDEKIMFSIAGTMANGDNMINAGVSFSLDRTSHVTGSRTAMAREILDLRQQVSELKSLVMQMAGKKVDAEMFPDVPENHWAYQYVEDLQKRGIIEGYPNGEFGGNRSCTRYEFAAMLDRALKAGQILPQKLMDEFKPELSRFRVDRVAGADDSRNKIERVRVNGGPDRDHYGSKLVAAAKK